MILPSASKIALAMRCAYPWHPRSFPWPKEPRSDAAKRGDAVHAVAEPHEPGESTEHLHARTAEDAVRVAVDDLTRDSLYLRERSIAYDPMADAARLLPKAAHRDYRQVRSGEFVGTFDLLVVRPGLVQIVDHKTGNAARKGRASNAWQLRMLAVAVRRLLGADFVDVAFVHVEDGDYRVDSHEFAPWDLDEYARALRGLVRIIEGAAQEPSPGPHCYDGYCPMRSTCPAMAAVVERVHEGAKLRLPVLGDEPRNDEEAKAWRTGLRMAEEWVERKRAGLAAYATRHPVDLGGGTMYGLVEVTKEDKWDLTVPGAADLVREVAGDEAIKVRITTSKDAIEAGARARQTKRGEGTKRVMLAYAELRKMGALSASTYSSVREFSRALPASDNEETEGKKAS